MNIVQIYESNYNNWLLEIKSKLKSTQLKTAISANKSLILFYYELGCMIVEKQETHKWGDKIINLLSKDLKSEFPNLGGLSTTNLKYCKNFYLLYSKSIGQQPVDQLVQHLCFSIPWGHNINIFTKVKNVNEANFYLEQTIENDWSRDVLALQIKSNLHKRLGKSVNNFKRTLPDFDSDLAEQTLKDPYVFDFLTIATPYREKDIEKQLVNQITNFLLELGKGFAFVGQQYHLEINGNDYYIDLLFYHIHLKSYVVVELKNTKFIPEFAGKLNFYLSAVDSLLKKSDDKPTIGILLCKDKDNFDVEFSLRDIAKPIGVSEFQLTDIIPEEFRSTLPTIEEIEKELKKKI